MTTFEPSKFVTSGHNFGTYKMDDKHFVVSSIKE